MERAIIDPGLLRLREVTKDGRYIRVEVILPEQREGEGDIGTSILIPLGDWLAGGRDEDGEGFDVSRLAGRTCLLDEWAFYKWEETP